MYNQCMKKRYSYIIILSILAIGLIADLVSKYLFARYFESGGEDIIVISNFFEFTYLKNTGAAYGLFGDSTVMLIIISIVFVGVFLLYDYFNHSNSWWYIIGISLILSGAIGNMVDRIFLGYVRDFISIKLFSFVFNIADLLITVGVICFLIFMVISMVKDYKRGKDAVDNK